MNMPVLLLRN